MPRFITKNTSHLLPAGPGATPNVTKCVHVCSTCLTLVQHTHRLHMLVVYTGVPQRIANPDAWVSHLKIPIVWAVGVVSSEMEAFHPGGKLAMTQMSMGR